MRSCPATTCASPKSTPALDVSDCFLRRCYPAQLGVNPLNDLKIRRLQLVRCALRHATADSLMPELAPRTRSGKRSVGPKQYLLLRRMTLAHRAVQAANPVETTVTEVAIRFGFWPSTGLPANTGHVRRSAIGHAWHRQAAQQNRPNPVSFRRDHMRLKAAAGTHGGRPACGSGGHLCHS